MKHLLNEMKMKITKKIVREKKKIMILSILADKSLA